MIKLIRKFFRGAPDAGSARPLISFIVIVYDMPEQAERTLRTLLPDYQTGVNDGDYEVVVVENKSGNVMSEEFLDSLPSNFRYFLRDETKPTPVFAIEYGASVATGENICLMIDGARLLTPGVVGQVVHGHRIHKNAVVTVPGYHLGDEIQQRAVDSGYGTEAEKALMATTDWPVDGYSLFDISCFSGSCADGFFLPSLESNCISMPRETWNYLGGCDLRFDARGGGLVNLDLYKRAIELPDTLHVIIPGEGTFHQFHGGVTTGGESTGDSAKLIEVLHAQYAVIRGELYTPPESDPLFFGRVPAHAHRFISLSVERHAEIMAIKAAGN